AAEDGIRGFHVTGVQTCALPIFKPNEDNEVSGGWGDDIIIGDHGGEDPNVVPGKSYNIALVVDTSGSMADPSGTPGLTRMQLVQAALKHLAQQLADHDGVVNLTLIDFSTSSSIVFSATDFSSANL